MEAKSPKRTLTNGVKQGKTPSIWSVRLHSSLENKAPAESRRALKQFVGSAHDALAKPQMLTINPAALVLIEG